MDLIKPQQMDLVQSKLTSQNDCMILAKLGIIRLPGMKGLAGLLWFSVIAGAAGPEWPQFRGPDLNPVGLNEALVDRWSKTEECGVGGEYSGARVVVTDRYRRQDIRDQRGDRG